MQRDDFDKRDNGMNSFESDTPKWQPDPVKYNTEYINTRKRRRRSKSWVVPLVIVIVVLVAVIVAGFTFGSKYISNLVNRSIAAPEEVEAETQMAEPLIEEKGNNVVWTEVASEEEKKDGVVITDVTQVVDEVFPAVVSITSRTIINDSDYFNFFFGYDSSPYGNSGGGQKEVDSGIGSGTIIGQDDEGLLILTSYHVVEDSSSLAVTFVNGTSVDGVIKSANSETDIAIVSVSMDGLDDETKSSIKTAKLSSTPAQMGEGVVVIGNAMGYGMSVTTGIVSAVDRQLTVDGKVLSVIQTDAAINSGNSGGCMLNSKGEVIGISEAKISVAGVEGMCYAIPVSNNSDLINSLLEEETPINSEDEPLPQGAYLGIRGRDITADLANTYNMPQGVYVSSVVTGGGAEAAGIKNGDIIVALDGVEATTMAKLQFELAKHNPDDVVMITVMREADGGYAQAEIEVTLTDAIS